MMRAKKKEIVENDKSDLGVEIFKVSTFILLGVFDVPLTYAIKHPLRQLPTLCMKADRWCPLANLS